MSSTSPPLINVGIVGLSTQKWAAVSHYPALSHPSLNSTFAISATQTSSEASAKAAAENYTSKPGISPSFSAYHDSDPSQIARDPKVDVVAVSVKVPHHKEYLEAAIEAGKPYFVEYPPGRDLAETLDILRKTEEKGLAAIVGLQGRHNPSMRKLKHIIEAGKIGKVLSTTLVALLPREARVFQPEVSPDNEYGQDPASGVSLLRVPIGHQLDTLMYILGPFTSLSARTSTQYPTTTIFSSDSSAQPRTIPSARPDHYTITGQLKSGAHANIVYRAGYTCTPGRTQLLWIIDGETGSITIQSDFGAPLPGSFVSLRDPERILVNSKPLNEYMREEGVEFEEDPGLVVEEGEKGLFIEFVRREWVEFGKTLRGGKGEYATMRDAVFLERVLDAVEESSSTGGKEVKI